MNRREVLLNAINEANRLHQRLNSEHRVQASGGGIDIFGSILELSVPLLFRPLDHLLGAYVPKPSAGIIITTERNLAIQRFTGAHELGHLILGHSGSLDDASILTRSPFGPAQYDTVEAAADAFATSFLLPKWLFEIHAERQDWDADSFDDPHIVYQLSLRIGASYAATCRSLARYNIIDQTTLNKHLGIKPKKIKQALLGVYQLEDGYSDVWRLTERDQGTLIQGGPKDVFLIHLKENSGAGYLWDVEELKTAGFVLQSDERLIPDEPEEIGGAVDRILMAVSQAEAAGKIDLTQSRPWEKASSTKTHYILRYDLFGKEQGLPRTQRGRAATI